MRSHDSGTISHTNEGNRMTTAIDTIFSQLDNFKDALEEMWKSTTEKFTNEEKVAIKRGRMCLGG